MAGLEVPFRGRPGRYFLSAAQANQPFPLPRLGAFGIANHLGLIAALLLARISRHVLPRPVSRRALPAALPWLSLFILVWMAGEMAGCLAGPGDALRRIE